MGGETKRPISDSNTRGCHETLTAPQRLIWDVLRWLGAGGGSAEGGTVGGAGQRLPAPRFTWQVLFYPGAVYLFLQGLFPPKLGESGSEQPRLCTEWVSSVVFQSRAYVLGNSQL